MRRFAVVIALLSPAVSLANLEWEKDLSWPIPEPYQFTSKAKDASGNIYFAGDREYASGLWKFSPDGKLAFERKLAIAIPHQVEVGTHEDIFLHGEEIVRVSKASGLIIWKVDAPKGMIHIDVNGDVLWSGAGLTRRYAYGTGALKWQKDFDSIPLSGSGMIANTTNGLCLADKNTGSVIQPVNLAPAPIGKLRGVGMKDGKAFLVDASGRAYGYRGSAPAYSLGYLPVEAESKFMAVPDGSVIIRLGGTVHTRFDAGFHRSWTQDFQGVLDVDATHMFVQTNYPTVLDLSTLSEKLRLAHDDYASSNVGTLANGVVYSISDRGQAVVRRNVLATGVELGTWRDSATIQRSGSLIAGGAGPNNDLLLYAGIAHHGFLVRVSAAGEFRWTIPVPDGGNAYPSLYGQGSFTVSRDKRRVAVTLSNPDRAYEFDVTTAKLTRSFKGWSVFHGDSAYRGNGITTSKFDLATEREFWRVPRTGPIAVGDDGSVYIGGTKNRGIDGSLVWNAGWETLIPFGEKVVAVSRPSIRLLSASTGVPFWNNELRTSHLLGGKVTPDVLVQSGKLIIRPSYQWLAETFNFQTGATGGNSTIGFQDPQGRTYRVIGHELRRGTDFFWSGGTEPVVALQRDGVTDYLSDGAGSSYMFAEYGAFLYVAKWKHED